MIQIFDPKIKQEFGTLLNPVAAVGFNNGVKYEPSNTVKYNIADCETVIEGKNNTWIVLGRDRPAGWDSGYGGKGHDKAGAIDIVAGRISSIDATSLNDYLVNPSPGADASRIYISQKANIDEYYGLAGGKTVGESNAKAAILIKSDDVRLISRNTFKIVTGTDIFLSNGNQSLLNVGVQLIANNDDRDMQPIPKGDNLVKAFKEMSKRMKELNSLIKTFMQIQMEFNSEISQHTHISPFYAQPVPPSPNAWGANQKCRLQLNLKVDQGTNNFTTNMKAFEAQFLIGGNDYINSSFHYLN